MSSKSSAFTRGFPRIAKQLGYNRHAISPVKVHVNIPGGLHYEAFDQTECRPKLRSLFLLFESARSFAFWPMKNSDSPGNSYADCHKLLMNNFFFIATARVDIDRKFYDEDTPKYPLTITKNLDYIGNSSFKMTSILGCPSSDFPYASCAVQTVLVDTVLRKPTALPEWWREKYGQNTEQNKPLIMERLSKPDDAMLYTATVSFSDIDTYKHTNWVSYVGFCDDAARDGIYRGQYDKITQDTVINGIKSFEIGFRKESSVEDKLDVFSWESDNSDTELEFEIRHGNETCIHAKMECHS